MELHVLEFLKGSIVARRLCLASSPGFSLLPRNNLRMTFDPPERKAEGEPGPFSHVIATRIYVRVTRFYVKAALKHGIVTLGTQSDHG